jgi:hypothetical protein
VINYQGSSLLEFQPVRYVELHVEQGDQLERAAADIAAVSGARTVRKLSVVFGRPPTRDQCQWRRPRWHAGGGARDRVGRTRERGRACVGAASYWRRRRFEGRGGIRVACTEARVRGRCGASRKASNKAYSPLLRGPAPHCGLRVFGRDDQPAGHRICIRRARGSRARAASPHFLSRSTARMLGSNPLRLNGFTMGQQRSNYSCWKSPVRGELLKRDLTAILQLLLC